MAMEFGNVRRACLTAGFALTLAAYASGAVAQQEGAPAGVQTGEPVETANLDAWIKICEQEQEEGPEICLVTQEVRTEEGEFLSSISLRQTEGEEGRVLLVAVPPGTMLQPGLRIQVDEGEQISGEYVICLPNACYAETEVDEDFVNQMKAGQDLVVSVINNQGQPVGIGLTLMGFTAAEEGEPVDTELLAQERQRLQEQLQQRAQDARQRLLQEEGEAPAAE